MKIEYINRIENELKNKKITAKKMLLELGYSDSLISTWKKGSEPSVIKLQKICEYLELDIGYIITGERTSVTTQEKQILEKWNKLDTTEKEIIEAEIDVLIKVKERRQGKLSV